jgi:hypothetical protein
MERGIGERRVRIHGGYDEHPIFSRKATRKLEISSKELIYFLVPLGTWVIWPRQVILPPFSVSLSHQILMMNDCG